MLLPALILSLAPQSEAPEPAAAPRPVPAAAPVSLFDYDRDGDLDVVEEGMADLGGCRRMDLSYASPGGGRVPAYLYEPVEDGTYAGILLMHGLPGSRDDMAQMAEAYVQTGAVVLAISAPWARPGVEGGAVSFTEKDREHQIQLVQDLRRGVDLLLTFPWVDPERLAYVGGSYGGAMGGLLAGVEDRLQAYALIVGDGGLVAHFTGPDDGAGPPRGLSDEAWRRWLDWMEPIEPIRFVGRAAPAALLFQNGRTDEFVPAEDARLYQEAGSEPKTVIWYDGGHGITPDRLRDQAKWLAERIGIDAGRFPG